MRMHLQAASLATLLMLGGLALGASGSSKTPERSKDPSASGQSRQGVVAPNTAPATIETPLSVQERERLLEEKQKRQIWNGQPSSPAQSPDRPEQR